LVDRFIYQGLRYVPSRTPRVIRPYAELLQDQDEKGSVKLWVNAVSSALYLIADNKFLPARRNAPTFDGECTWFRRDTIGR
jgi:hypothetical protein